MYLDRGEPRTEIDRPSRFRLPNMQNPNTYLTNLTELNLVLESRPHATSVHCETYLPELLQQTDHQNPKSQLTFLLS